MKAINLTLPEYAFIEDATPNGVLNGRSVVYHTRTASVIEIILAADAFLSEKVVTIPFSYTNRWGVSEEYIAALHYSATIDAEDEGERLRNVMQSAIDWYCDYMKWEDKNVDNEDMSVLN